MAKTKIKNNIPLVVRKIDKDLLEIQKTIGSSTADLVNFAMLDIQKKGVQDGRGSVIKPKNHNKFDIYGAVAGGNRASKFRKNVMAYNKNKVVERKGDIAKAFRQVSFKISNRFSKSIAKGSNGFAEVNITRMGSNENPKGQLVHLSWGGKMGDLLANLHFGNKNGAQTVKIRSSNGKMRNAKIGQRAIVFNGLKRAMRRWNQYVEYKLTGTIKKRNKAKK
jgi:hypothetical protein